MSTGTNQERLEQNNELLEDIKTQVDNLPEFQEIETIDGDILRNYEPYLLTPSQTTYEYSCTYIFDRRDNKAKYQVSLTTSKTGSEAAQANSNAVKAIRIYKLKYNDDNTITREALRAYEMNTDIPLVAGSASSVSTIYSLYNTQIGATYADIDNPYLIIYGRAASNNGAAIIAFNIIPFNCNDEDFILDIDNMFYLQHSSLSNYMYPCVGRMNIQISPSGKKAFSSAIMTSSGSGYLHFRLSVDVPNKTGTVDTTTWTYVDKKCTYITEDIMEIRSTQYSSTYPDESYYTRQLRIFSDTNSTLATFNLPKYTFVVLSDAEYCISKDATTNDFIIYSIQMNLDNKTINFTEYKRFTLPAEDSLVKMNWTKLDAYPMRLINGNQLLCQFGTVFKQYIIDLTADIPLQYARTIDGMTLTGYESIYNGNTLATMSNKIYTGTLDYRQIKGVKYLGKTFYRYAETDKTATAPQVLSGYTYTGAESVPMVGTMTDNGAIEYTPSDVIQDIAIGYHNGSKVLPITSSPEYTEALNITEQILN